MLSPEVMRPRQNHLPGREPVFWPGLFFAFAATSMAVGIIWDISWHTTIGRDAFWTPAHMAIYLGGALGGMTGGWLAFKHTFLAGPEGRDSSVGIFGGRAPLGALVAIWGAVAMLTSAPFDNWWHNAYGLDVKIVSPPHALLGIGMLSIISGALLLVLARQNRATGGAGAGLFIYVGGILLTMVGVFASEYCFPNEQHAALFYEVCAAVFCGPLVALGRAGRVSWPATRAAAVYIGITCLMAWILPLFPAQPKLAPIFNPLTHMVPPAFPLLLIFPAFAIDLILRRTPQINGWLRNLMLAALMAAAFLAVVIPVQWYFAKFLISPYADNWFFVGNRIWSYADGPGKYRTTFWHVRPDRPDADLFGPSAAGLSWALGTFSAWLGLLRGGWMRKVRR